MTLEPKTKLIREGSTEEVLYTPTNGSVTQVPQSWLDLGPLPAIYYTQPFTGLWELYTPNSDGSTSAWKPFQHYKRVAEMDRSALLIPHWTGHWNGLDDGSAGLWGHLGYHHDKVFAFHVFGGADNPTVNLAPLFDQAAPGGFFIPPPQDLDSLKQQALKSMLPSMKVGLSLINSLIETRDFKSLPRTLASIRDLVLRFKDSAYRSALTKIRDITGKRSRSEFRTVLADTYLQWSFNIQPLLSDVRGIYLSLDRLERDVNRLIAGSAKLQRRHYVAPISELTDLDESQPVIQYATNSMFMQGYGYRYVRSEVSKFHAMIEYHYNYTQYQLQHAAILALLDSFSINLGLAKIVWNATKWTFVIDWVLGVSRWLDQFSLANMAPVINIRRCLWSISRKRQISCRLDLRGSGLTNPHATQHPASVVWETAYRRDLWQPTSSSIQLGGLNLKEFTLGAALIQSRRRVRRHKR